MKREVVTEWGNLAYLRMSVEGFLDAQKARTSAKNRAERGDVADVYQQAKLIAPALELEAAYKQMLLDAYRQVVPTALQGWASQIPGLASGTLFPSIIALIGDPRRAHPCKWVPGAEIGSKDARVLVADGDSYDRSVRQFWQWCGCGDPMIAPKFVSTKDNQGLKLAMGKRTTLRPRLFTFTSYLQLQSGNESVAGSRYGKLLIESKADACGHDGKCDKGAWPTPCSETHKRHGVQCQNKKRPPMASNGCGTVADPEWGEPGSPWRPGHAQAHSHRIVQKEFLRDLWEFAGTI